MTNMIPDLLPSDLIAGNYATPFTILSAQAARLTTITGGLVNSRVRSLAANSLDARNGFDRTIAFELVVPTLNNYTYRVLTASYPLAGFPVAVTGVLANEVRTRSERLAALLSDPKDGGLKSEEELVEFLRVAFDSDAFRRIMASLMAEAQAEAQLHSSQPDSAA